MKASVRIGVGVLVRVSVRHESLADRRGGGCTAGAGADRDAAPARTGREGAGRRGRADVLCGSGATAEAAGPRAGRVSGGWSVFHGSCGALPLVQDGLAVGLSGRSGKGRSGSRAGAPANRCRKAAPSPARGDDFAFHKVLTAAARLPNSGALALH